MRNVKMIAVLLCLVAGPLLALGDAQLTVEQKLSQLGGWLEKWQALTVTYQAE